MRLAMELLALAVAGGVGFLWGSLWSDRAWAPIVRDAQQTAWTALDRRGEWRRFTCDAPINRCDCEPWPEERLVRMRFEGPAGPKN